MRRPPIPIDGAMKAPREMRSNDRFDMLNSPPNGEPNRPFPCGFGQALLRRKRELRHKNAVPFRSMETT